MKNINNNVEKYKNKIVLMNDFDGNFKAIKMFE